MDPIIPIPAYLYGWPIEEWQRLRALFEARYGPDRMPSQVNDLSETGEVDSEGLNPPGPRYL